MLNLVSFCFILLVFFCQIAGFCLQHSFHLFMSDTQNQPPEVYCKKGVLRNFSKLTGKYLCQEVWNFIKKETLVQVFSKFLRTPFLQCTSRRMLLYTIINFLLLYHVIITNFFPCQQIVPVSLSFILTLYHLLSGNLLVHFFVKIASKNRPHLLVAYIKQTCKQIVH